LIRLKYRKYLPLRGLLILSALVWCLTLFAPPLLQNGSREERRAAAWIILAFSPLCHQEPARSFQVDGHPMAVCARCTGIYLGFLLGLITVMLFRIHRPPTGRMIAGCFVPSALFMALTATRWVPDLSWLRALAGAPLGAVTGILALTALDQWIQKNEVAS